MKHIIPKQKEPMLKYSIEHLHNKSLKWISEMEFIKIEQEFLREILVEHIMELCCGEKFSKAKLMLHGIDHEEALGVTLIDAIKEHRVNLALLMENIYLKKEDSFREQHELLKIEVQNYIENFKYIKEQVFELILNMMKKEKEKKLIHH